MGRLILAEPGSTIYASRQAQIADNYINVPTAAGGVIKVREDYFDQLPNAEWNQVMDALEPYNAVGMSGLFSGWRERRKEKREDRQAHQIARAQAGGGIGNAIKGIVGAITGGAAGAVEPQTGGSGYDQTKELMINASYNKPVPMTQQPWFWPVAIGGVGLLAWTMLKK